MANDELKHYGVKGMRWGFRKGDTDRVAAYTKLAKKTSEGLNTMATPYNKASKSTKPSRSQRKALSQMTDQELRARVNRLNMEQQYIALSPSRKARGAAAVGSMLETAGSVAAVGASALGIALAIMQIKQIKS